jgi:hypothetical protein
MSRFESPPAASFATRRSLAVSDSTPLNWRRRGLAPAVTSSSCARPHQRGGAARAGRFEPDPQPLPGLCRATVAAQRGAEIDVRPGGVESRRRLPEQSRPFGEQVDWLVSLAGQALRAQREAASRRGVPAVGALELLIGEVRCATGLSNGQARLDGLPVPWDPQMLDPEPLVAGVELEQVDERVLGPALGEAKARAGEERGAHVGQQRKVGAAAAAGDRLLGLVELAALGQGQSEVAQ